MERQGEQGCGYGVALYFVRAVGMGHSGGHPHSGQLRVNSPALHVFSSIVGTPS
jgi:hypothetical protein